MGSQVSVDTGAVHVVIVGGGFGGIAAASQLQALNIPFMLVDMKDSFHHNVAALRASVESGELPLGEYGLVIIRGHDVRAGAILSIQGELLHVLHSF